MDLRVLCSWWMAHLGRVGHTTMMVIPNVKEAATHYPSACTIHVIIWRFDGIAITITIQLSGDVLYVRANEISKIQ